MALRFWDGFDYLALTGTIIQAQMQGRGWINSSTNWTAATGRFGGQSATIPASGNLRYDVTGNPVTAVVGAAFYLNSTPSAAIQIVELIESAVPNVQVGVGLDTNRRLIVYRGSVSTVLATGTTVLPNGAWTYIEFKAKVDPTTGTYEVRINGLATPELSATGQNTRNSSNSFLTGFRLLVSANAISCRFDDIYFLDTTGSAPLNDFLGETRVQTLWPTGAGASTQWTPSVGSNWQNVDDGNGGNMDSDTTYNSSATVGQIDSFALQDLSGTPTVYSVAMTWDARKDDAAARQVRSRLKSGATIANGTTQTMGSSFAGSRDVWDTDPATGVAWTSSGVNALEAGYEMIA